MQLYILVFVHYISQLRWRKKLEQHNQRNVGNTGGTIFGTERAKVQVSYHFYQMPNGKTKLHLPIWLNKQNKS